MEGLEVGVTLEVLLQIAARKAPISEAVRGKQGHEDQVTAEEGRCVGVQRLPVDENTETQRRNAHTESECKGSDSPLRREVFQPTKLRDGAILIIHYDLPICVK
ncbi:hypothetical protein CO174_00430 [Candidatus Uhrbacteria bacterium CG_4_9_14_3_um_filter_50_9]|uniref:Uncharacterized protein n=1 Tax=Candidatus Uhrbacteria bacterium CG_4_9_14_3_um_filter_50_9 TaxID=1975035 RepID=A0A2M7XEI0_9BACT|nr:MAG: hypothetical protein CO174_00430 [Candidatus Uhrbacteria bacterium CG_4_9_14_3_um_filter_50_9]